MLRSAPQTVGLPRMSPLKNCCCSVTQPCLTLRPHGPQPARLLRPWDSPGKNTGVGCHFLLQGISPTQGSNLCPLHWQADSSPGKPSAINDPLITCSAALAEAWLCLRAPDPPPPSLLSVSLQRLAPELHSRLRILFSPSPCDLQVSYPLSPDGPPFLGSSRGLLSRVHAPISVPSFFFLAAVSVL